MVFDMANEKLSILALQAQVVHMGFLFLDLEYAPNTQLYTAFDAPFTHRPYWQNAREDDSSFSLGLAIVPALHLGRR